MLPSRDSCNGHIHSTNHKSPFDSDILLHDRIPTLRVLYPRNLGLLLRVVIFVRVPIRFELAGCSIGICHVVTSSDG